MLKNLKDKIIAGYRISKEEAILLLDENIDELCTYADELRRFFCGDTFELCSIINGKSGGCSENCTFCAQSVFHKTSIDTYTLVDEEIVIKSAIHNAKAGILRFSIVTSGRTLRKDELEILSRYYRTLSEKKVISLCASHGLLSYAQLVELKKAGVKRYHNNLETSRSYFPSICTTHTYEDKIETIRNAQKAGLEVCSGGIIGLGESWQDRIDMAFELRSLGIASVPMNFLNPIKGTPCEENNFPSMEELRRVIAMYRFIMPDVALRLAGGRGLLANRGKSLMSAGANAAITMDMLTTQGVGVQEDIVMVEDLGYQVGNL